MTDYGYARVSTLAQDLETQRQRLIQLGVEPEFIESDKKSGTTLKRRGLQRLLNEVKRGDRVHVTKLDRLGRNLRELQDVGSELERRGVALVLDGRAFDPTDAIDRMFFNLLGIFAEFERDLIASRTKDRLDYLREQGVSIGRKRSTTDQQELGILKLRELGATVSQIAKTAQVSQSTINRVLARHKVEAEVQSDPDLLRRRRANQTVIRKAQDELRQATALAKAENEDS